MIHPTKIQRYLPSIGIANVAYKRSWNEIFSATLPNPKDVASRRLFLMSLGRHWEIYPNHRSAGSTADAPVHPSDEFPAGYSLTGCSPALVSASPAALSICGKRQQEDQTMPSKPVSVDRSHPLRK
jgi:hypothetical protein